MKAVFARMRRLLCRIVCPPNFDPTASLLVDQMTIKIEKLCQENAQLRAERSE